MCLTEKEDRLLKSAAVRFLPSLFFLFVKLGPCVGQNSYFFLLVQPLLDLLSHNLEHLLDVLAGLGAGLVERHSHFLGQGLTLLVLDLSVVHVGLVADEDLHDAVRGVELDLLDPVLDVVEAVPLVDGVGEDDAHGAPVVGLRDGLELLLAGGVPDLEADAVLADQDGLGLEVDADRGEVGGHEVVLAVLEQHVRLAHPAVTNHQQLYQAVVALVAVA